MVCHAWVICDNRQLSKEEVFEAVKRALDLGMMFHQQKMNRVNSKSVIETIKNRV